jgi:hypothetical protein
MATETEIGRSPSGRAAAADAVEPVPVSSKASIPNAFTPGPWYVRDLSAATMRKLGWTGPSIDRILITNKTGAEIIRDEGEDCVIARIQFDNRPEELREGNLADARLIAAAPELYEALERLLDQRKAGFFTEYVWEAARAALAKARGEA